jgi:hypothetical protein
MMNDEVRMTKQMLAASAKTVLYFPLRVWSFVIRVSSLIREFGFRHSSFRGLGISRIAIVLVAATLCASCASQKPADDAVFSKSAPTEKGNDDMPVPPKDAQFTIYCQQFNGPNHMAEARQAKTILSDSTPLAKKWYVVHGNDQSTLYYGFYRSFDTSDPQFALDAKRALGDLDAIRMIRDSQGVRLFSASLPVPIDAPNPEANPAWDLTNAKGYWSVEIAAYNAPGRKEAAVESVRAARKQGIEAYYYHGPTASSVCVGTWPQDAATEITTASENIDPNKPVLVTPAPLSDAYKKQLGDNVQTAAPHVDIADPTLREALDTWEHDVNGEALMKPGLDPVTKQQVQVREKAFLVKIPHSDGVPAMAETNTPVQPDDAVINPIAPTPGAGQLRSLDGH